MAATRSCALARTVPTKQPMPPMSVRSAVSAASSAPMSKSAVCTLILAMPSASCHRREECDLVAGADARGGVGEVLVHRAANRSAVGEGARVAGAAFHQPGDECVDRAHPCGQRDALQRPAGALAQPGEVEDGHWRFGIGHEVQRGVGTVSILPSECMIVLVPLPLGTTMAEPPPGGLMVW